jgi:hypothetical protein
MSTSVRYVHPFEWEDHQAKKSQLIKCKDKVILRKDSTLGLSDLTNHFQINLLKKVKIKHLKII